MALLLIRIVLHYKKAAKSRIWLPFVANRMTHNHLGVCTTSFELLNSR